MARKFSPGCALYMYNPHISERLNSFLNDKEPLHLNCCHKPETNVFSHPTEVISACTGCHNRYSTLYEGVTGISLWQALVGSDFPFPDYKKEHITVHDACTARNKPEIHKAVRTLLKRMNFEIIEAPNSQKESICCGDSFYGKVPKEELLGLMKKRADTLPVSNVAVYCVSCIKSIHNGGKKPRYMADLLFGEDTLPGECDPDNWHNSIKEFIKGL